MIANNIYGIIISLGLLYIVGVFAELKPFVMMMNQQRKGIIKVSTEGFI